MSSTLTIDGKEYVTAVVAGKEFGYTKDYLLMLAKQGKVDGKKVGNRWYINLPSAELFFKEGKKRKEERSQRIRAERKLELQQSAVQQKQSVRTPYAKAAVIETFIIVIIGLSLGATGYLGTTHNAASVQSGEYGFFETLAVSVYNFFSPKFLTTEEHFVVTQNTNHNTNQIEESAVSAQITHTSLLVAPEDVFTATTIESIEKSFSDEVRITVDPDNPDTGVLIPVFKAREGESYRFLMVPVNEKTQ